MLQLQEALRRKKRNLIIWFNPWRHDKEDAVWAAFALQFIHDIKKQLWFWQRWMGNLRLLIRRFSWEQGWIDLTRKIFLWFIVLGVTAIIGYTAYLNKGEWTANLAKLAAELLKVKGAEDIFSKGIEAGGVTAYIALVLSIFSKLESIVGDPLKVDLKKFIDAPNYGDRVSFIERFHRDFKHIVDAYAGKKPVYVFIDDVDRCEVPKAADLMSALNLMISNDVKIIFIIGMDPEKVAAGLAVKHEKLFPYLFVHDKATEDNHLAGLSYGYDFIKKFIQISFLLPRPDDNALDEFMQRISEPRLQKGFWESWRDNLRKIFQQEPPEISLNIINAPYIHEVARQIAPALENNPRHIKQFINVLRLQIYIADKTGLFQDEEEAHLLTPQQYSKFIAVKLQWPLLIDDLDAHPKLLSTLQLLALDPDNKEISISPYASLEFWQRRADLMEFLNLGCRDVQGSRIPDAESLWSLEHVDILKLLKVSSQVHKAPSIDDSMLGKESKSAEAAKLTSSVSPLPTPTSITSRVILMIVNPINPTTGQNLVTARSWNDPIKLSEEFCRNLKDASHGLVNVEIAGKFDVHDWLPLPDGFRYDWESYQNIFTGKTPPHIPPEIDYQMILKTYDVPRLISEDQIDEIWIFACPYAGIFESTMGGKGAFWCNAPPLKINTRKRFVIMGFSYERGVGEMLEAYGHRAESILEETFRSKSEKNNLWRQFIQYDKIFPGNANVGTIHFAPNSDRDYDWGSPRKVPSNCYDWLNFPDFKGEIREVNASEWGDGETKKHHMWWFEHLPHVGGDTDGISNNWWEYICNLNNVKGPP
jgi:hypothetical protein